MIFNFKEVILDDKTGLVTRTKNPESFATAIARLVWSDDPPRSMGEKGRLHVAEKGRQNAFNDFGGDHLSSDPAD